MYSFKTFLDDMTSLNQTNVVHSREDTLEKAMRSSPAAIISLEERGASTKKGLVG